MVLLLTTAYVAFMVVISAATVPARGDWQHGRVQLPHGSLHFRYAGRGPAVLLVHGNPQHSITWRLVGPRLAQNFTVIAPDNRGMGDSTIPSDGDFTSSSMAADLDGLLAALNIFGTFLVAYDKGVGPAVALAALKPSLVRALTVIEYVLPGFGYEDAWTPSYEGSAYGNWELAAWSVPDAAEMFIRGRVREMLGWFFYHDSYSGVSSIPLDVVQAVVDSIDKPGFLRSMLGPFAAYTVGADASFFNATLRAKPLTQPFLALGGEAATGPVIKAFWSEVPFNGTTDVIPKAGHFPADENAPWLVQRLRQFFAPYTVGISDVDISWYADRVTLSRFPE